MTRANINHTSIQTFSALKEFKAKLPQFNLQPEQESKDAPTRPAFVRTQHLRQWLASTTREGAVEVTNIERLIDDAFQKRGGRYANLPHNNVEHILDNHSLVFCLLLEANKGHLIYDLRRHQITDNNLCDKHEKFLDEKLWDALAADGDDNPEDAVQDYKALFETFVQRRWAYRPHVFEYGEDPELSGSTILPIYKRERINRGGTAAIYQICVPEEYLDEEMKQRLDGSSFPVESVGTCYNLAVKTFTESGRHDDLARELFQRECEAYKYLDKHKGMVQYLGAYSHRNSLGRIEHNILLEYGDYDLAEYFGFSPPVHPANVCNLWHDLFDVVDALSRLHTFVRLRCGRKEQIQGWHNDIKPDNILIVKGQLKLADPGFAGFAQYVHGQSTPRPSVVLMSSTYGPPESHLASHETEMPQAADMWSLGCVLSEAATWLILGPPGLTQYRTLRKDAICRANETHRQRTPKDASASGTTSEGDYFHNGHAVLPEIAEWHKYLASNLRKSDQISEMVLGLIDRCLLQSDPRDRSLNAGLFCHDLDEIRSRFPRDRESGLPRAVETAVTGVEARLKWEPLQALLGQSLSIQVRKALKTKGYLEFPRDGMVHLSEMIKERFEVLVSELPRLSLNTARASHNNSNSTAYTASPADLSSTNPTASFDVPRVTSPQQTVQPTSLTNKAGRRPSPYPPENIFDAHYASKKNSVIKNLKGRFGGAKDKDVVLKDHYQYRDIKFIVDNSGSSIPEWQKVRFVLEKISGKAANIDEDGMDLEFANRCGRVLKINEKNLIKDIENAMNEFRPTENDETNMAEKLAAVLARWLDKRPRKGMTLIVLTDGQWKGMMHPDGVGKTIAKFHEEVKKLPAGKLKSRWVSVQFISFGDDPDALNRLQYLDNDLAGDKNIEDIVDTEPWTGDVYKMLLGSHVANIDLLDNEAERSGVASPIMQRRDILLPTEQADQLHHRQPSTRHERFSSASHFRSPTRSAPRGDTSSQSAYPTRRESTDRRQRPKDSVDHYRYPA